LFVATANNIENMTPEMLDRFEIVQVEGYSKIEKLDIAKK
jgi:ATP-dependent Lon protease